MSQTTRLTLEQFWSLPVGEYHSELIDGQAVPKVSPKEFHSMLTLALANLLTRWASGQGRVRLEWAIALQRNGADWVPIPDVTYVSYERLPPSILRNSFCPVPPELVIEIMSPGQALKNFQDKADDYFAAGVLRVWLVDPEAISIRLFYPKGVSTIYIDDTNIVDTLFPGLEPSVNQIFAEAGLL